MEELNNKLKFGSKIAISQVISGLVQGIKRKQNEENTECWELKFLKQKCTAVNRISEVACRGILYLVEENVLKVEPILADFTSIITTSKCPSTVIHLINNLLLKSAEHQLRQGQGSESLYNSQFSRHPLITLLNENPSCWYHIFQEIIQSYSGNKDELVVAACDAVYKPLLKSVYCDPDENNFSTFKNKLWKIIINLASTDVIFDLLHWMQFESSTNSVILENGDLLNDLAELNLEKRIFDVELILLWQTSVLYHCILDELDPRDLIYNLRISVEEAVDSHYEFNVLDSVLLIICKSITICSVAYILDLLKLSELITQQSINSFITLQIFKASIMHWMVNSSLLTLDAAALANKLFTQIHRHSSTHFEFKRGGTARFLSESRKILHSNTEVYLSLQMCILFEDWRNGCQITKWLESLNDVTTSFLFEIVHCLYALFLENFGETVNLRAFELILKCARNHQEITPHVLTLILYKLSNTVYSNLHFKLLKALPEIANLKENYSKVLLTLQALTKGPSTLAVFATNLMFDLWKIDNKCYTHLEDLLIVPYRAQGNKWEFYVTRANVLRELCMLKPELYGKDMVPHLSQILNECNDDDGALACALALEGISALCKAEVIDAVTTWASLSPVLKNDRRIQVIQSLCALISEVPSFSYADAYPKLIEEVVLTLWQYIQNYDDVVIWEAALDALTSFSLEQITSQMPEEYMDEENINLRKSGQTVSGHCWILFLQNCSELTRPVAGDFLIKMISLEVSNYLKHVYHVKGTREPLDYSYLPSSSIVRSIGHHIKSKVLKRNDSIFATVYVECLRIFSKKFSKPLPPLDWCFLQEVIHEPEKKNYCIDIASHQVMLSGTARRLVENYVIAVTERSDDPTVKKDVQNIYRNLTHMANSIQPVTLKPFFEATIQQAVNLFKEGDSEQLLYIVKYLKETLQNNDIQDTNKVVIGEILSDLLRDEDVDSQLFTVLLECIISFPQKCLKIVSSPKAVKEVTLKWYLKAVKIRSFLALNAEHQALNWLNELIDIGYLYKSESKYVFAQYAGVFKKHQHNTECALWVLDLIGQIQAAVTDVHDEKQVLYLCDIFILAVVVFSGHFIFTDDIADFIKIRDLFPQAVASLLAVNHWSICTTQALEWFYHMYKKRTFGAVYSEMFEHCLQALRHEEVFKKNMKWVKYLNI